MTDLSIQQHLPPAPAVCKKAPQLIAPMFPRPSFIPGQGKAPKVRRSAPRPMPVVKKGLEDSLLTDIVLFGGDHLAALAFVQIRYWSSAAEGKTIPRHLYKNSHDGKNDWVYKSASDWFKELAMSPAQVQRVNAVFNEHKAIDVAVVRRGKSLYHYYRLSDAYQASLMDSHKSNSLHLLKTIDEQSVTYCKKEVSENTSGTENTEKTTPAADASLAAGQAKSKTVQGETKPPPIPLMQ